MQEQSFEQLAADAAAGLKADQELFLDVTQELQTHLVDTARSFTQQGKSEDESAELARKAFGSPLDVAADLLEANRGRMKLRSLIRLAFGAVIVPLAIILALYVGYGRFARLHEVAMQQIDYSGATRVNTALPMLPFFGVSLNPSPVVHDLRETPDNADRVLRFWEAHRRDPDSRIYYALYASLLQSDERSYVAAMRRGEQIEPQNALYNLLLANYYLEHGIIARTERARTQDAPPADKMLDRRACTLGIAELRSATQKPYLRGYEGAVLRKKLDSLPHPLLTEDYLAQIYVMSTETLPNLGRYRALARKIPASARMLAAEGQISEATAVMDTWKPFTTLLAGDLGTELSALWHGAVPRNSRKKGLRSMMSSGHQARHMRPA